MDYSINYGEIIISLIMTAVAYVGPPVAYSFLIKKRRITKSEAKKICIISGVCMYLVFFFLYAYFNIDGGGSLYPAVIWSSIAYWILSITRKEVPISSMSYAATSQQIQENKRKEETMTSGDTDMQAETIKPSTLSTENAIIYEKESTMKCQRCETEFDTSSAPMTCPKCGYPLPCSEITLKVISDGNSKEMQGRMLVDGEYLRFAKKKISENRAAKRAFGLIGTAIIDSVEKSAGLSFRRNDFSDIKRVEGPQGNLFYYELITSNDVFRVTPSTSKNKDFEAAMDNYINLECSDIEEKVEKAPATDQITSDSSNSSNIPFDALKTLKELHDDGVINDKEYAEKKKQILGL